MISAKSIAIILALNAIQAFSFSTNQSPLAVTSRQGVALYATNNDTHENHITSRRQALKTTITTAAAVTIASPFISNADDTGKLIEFTVNNLDGNEGSTGTFVVKTHPEWAPIGAERFETLAETGFFDGCRVFRVLPGFVSQFGINGK